MPILFRREASGRYAVKPTKEMKPSIEVGDVIQMTCDCEVGAAGERGVITYSNGRYMTIVFPNRPARGTGGTHDGRVVHTGADYRFIRINPPDGKP